MSEKLGESQPSLTAENLMTTKIQCVTTEMTISDCIGMMLTHRIRGAPVVDTSKRVISEITEADLLKLAATKGLTKTVGNCLSSLPTLRQMKTLKKNASFSQIYKEFLGQPVNRIIIIDDTEKLQGIVSRSDILRILFRPKEEVTEDNAVRKTVA